MASIVRIESVGPGGGEGTGFVISNDGLIMTNNHVIASHDTTADHPFTYIVLQKVGDRVIAHPAEFVAQDPNVDLAILRCSGIKVSPFQFLLPAPQVFQEVYSMGFPGVADETQVIAGEQVGLYAGDAVNAISEMFGHEKATPLDITDSFPEAFKKHTQATIQHIAQQLQEIDATLANPDTLKKKAAEEDETTEDLKKELEATKTKLDALKKRLENFCATVQASQLTKFVQDFATPTSTTGKVEKVTEGSVNGGPLIPLIEHGCNSRGGNSGGPLVNEGGQVLGVVGDAWAVPEGPHKGELVKLAVQTAQVQKFLQANGINNCNFTVKEQIPKPNYLPIIIAASLAITVALAALLITLFKARRKTGMTALLESLKAKGVTSGTKLLEYIGGGKPGHQSSPSRPAIVPASPGNGWKLDVRTSAGKTFRIPISEAMFASNGSRLVLGRSDELCDLVVEDETVSRQHADIRRNGRGFEVADRNSSNGTAVNGVFIRKPFEHTPLKPGDTLTVGNVKLDFDKN